MSGERTSVTATLGSSRLRNSSHAACAAAVSAARTGRTGRKVTIDVASSPIRVPLTIDWREDNHVIMTGPAEWEWSGSVDPVTGVWARDAVERGAV